MAKRRPTLTRFRPSDPLELVAAVTGLRESRAGWVNFWPYFPEDGALEANLDGTWDDTEYQRPKGAALGIGGMLMRPAPPIPECTWVPGEDHRRKGRQPDSVGMAHPGGRKAGPVLVEAGMRLDDGWKVVADTAGRGLILALSGDYDVREAMTWILKAADLVTPFDVPDDWVLEVHTTAS
jgi:hypothetical protein